MGLLSWLSGTAAWMYVAVTQYLLGIKPVLNGLEINPCLPADWGECRVIRKFRNNEVEVNIHGGGVSPRLIVDGKTCDGNFITDEMLGKNNRIQVEVYMS